MRLFIPRMAASNSEPAGARPQHFATTRWSVVLAARDDASPASRGALESLCRGYWYPLYAFVRRSGHSPHDAEDLTQDFFARLLEKHWLAAVEQDRGRFRSFMVMAMKRFLANEWDKSQTARRGGGHTHVPLDAEAAEARYAQEPAATYPADFLYERRWALTLLDNAMACLHREFERDGRDADFQRLKEFLTAERGEIPYARIAEELHMSEGAARVAIHRLRKRFREIFRQTIADTVTDAADVEAEVRYVVEILGRA
jgi:RNA polymerase sigma factor (sigma-70 family)